MTDLRELQKEIHQTAIEKGWWEKDRPFGELMMLVVTEAAEAMEAWREGKEPFYLEDDKPEGVDVEMADIIIRVLDIAGHFGVDMERVLAHKMAYNKTRPYRHGGKRA